MSEQFTMHDLKNKTLGAGEVVLDARTPEEYAEGHVKGAINISHEEVIDHLGELKKYKTVYMHCRSGGRIRSVQAELTAAGAKNFVFLTTTGMKDWIEAGYPVEK